MNSKTLRYAGALLSLSLTCGMAVACGGFSDEEAIARCDQELDARGGGGCFTLPTYDECVGAFQDCGDDVVIGESCPLSYSCPE